MERLRKICKVCGKEYEACFTQRLPGDGNRWQDVACCPEHGAEYIASVLAARCKQTIHEVSTAEDVEPPKKAVRKRRDTDED